MASIDFGPYLNVKNAVMPVFSADGSRLTYLSDITGTLQVWTVPLAGGWADQLTFYDERVTGLYTAPAGDRLLFSRDKGGDEKNQIYVLDGSREQGVDITTVKEDFTLKHIFGAWRPDSAAIAFSSNDRDLAYFDVYIMELSENGAAKTANMVARFDGSAEVSDWSASGRYLLITLNHTNLIQELFLLDVPTGALRSLTGQLGQSMFMSAQFSHDEQAIYFSSDLGRDFRALWRMPLDTVPLDTVQPEIVVAPSWDVETLKLSPDGQRIAYVINEGGKFSPIIRDVLTGKEQRINGLPPGTVGDLTWSRDSSKLAFDFNSPIYNADIWVIDLKATQARQVTFSPRGGLNPATFATPDLIHFPTFDGRQIPALWYLPRDARPDGKTPVVVSVHGGPESQVTFAWSPLFQYLVRRGYAVLAPNVRGSSGYGKEYLSLDDVRKRPDSVTDLKYAVDWLRQNEYADASRVAVYGGSYGGFMVLSALTTFPELWAVGVDIVGIANMVTFLENTSSYRRKLREAEYGSLDTDRDFLTEVSPIHRISRIAAPLMVIHGAQDPRVPIGEAEQVVESLRGRGQPVEYQRFEDEGHGITKLKNRLVCYPKIADFLDRYLMA